MCWGKNRDGQLGIGSTDDAFSPTVVDFTGSPGFLLYVHMLETRRVVCHAADMWAHAPAGFCFFMPLV
jgi:hypothetical protein